MKLFLKLFLEFLPLCLFFIFTDFYGFYAGTIVMMVSTVVSTALVWWIFGKLAWMALITAATGLASGGLTLFYTDPLYVKLKPTIVSLFFAGILFLGLLTKRPLLKRLIGLDLHVSDQGWSVITFRWAVYFVFVALLNEYIWRNYSIEFWAGFKAFGLMPITILYGLAQVPLLKQHRTPGAPEDGLLDEIARTFARRAPASVTDKKAPVRVQSAGRGPS